MADPSDTWGDPQSLIAEQQRVGALHPDPWVPGDTVRVAACFVAFAAGEQGPGRAGDRAWVAAVMAVVHLRASGSHAVDVEHHEIVTGRAGGSYVPGLLAMREGPMMSSALRVLLDRAGTPEVLMVDATGRDHPRRCGVAVHLGWYFGIPSVGVTHRMLTRRPEEPPELFHRGATTPVDGIAAWVCTQDHVRPLVAHAAWRTDAHTAAQLVVRSAVHARTPEPLRSARELARTARSGG